MTVSVQKADTTLPVPPTAPQPAAEQESFVINLCSSTTPMALTQPQLAELKNFTFFVSRRLEDGRERFRLHMGYFDSQLQAEELLPLVRDLYPGAWAGEAPGKRLRARAAAAKAAPAPAPTPVAVPTPSIKAVPTPVAATPKAPPPAPPAPRAAEPPSADLLARMPTLTAAPQSAALPEPQAVPAELPFTLELVADPPAPVAAAESEPFTLIDEPAPVAPPKSAVSAPAAEPSVPPAEPAKRPAAVAFDQRSNVREVLKSLDESGRHPPKPLNPPVPEGPAVRQPGVLPESQVLHLLEEKRGDPLNTTSTPAAFSVQLQWSVQPIDLARVPPLAIFGAYTLYTVEGSREGRRWYGLRLGFFSDANSAKQVAQYVRSEFSSVAVVPVSLKERDGANGANGGPAGTAAAKKVTERLPDQSGEFKLLDDTGETPKLPAELPAAPLRAPPWWPRP